MGLLRAAPSAAVAGPTFTRVRVAGHELLLSRLSDGTPVAFGTTCGHEAQPLTFGVLDRDQVDCPHHHYRYDPRTGGNTFPGDASDRPIEVYAVHEEDGWVWVDPRARP